MDEHLSMEWRLWRDGKPLTVSAVYLTAVGPNSHQVIDLVPYRTTERWGLHLHYQGDQSGFLSWKIGVADEVGATIGPWGLPIFVYGRPWHVPSMTVLPVMYPGGPGPYVLTGRVAPHPVVGDPCGERDDRGWRCYLQPGHENYGHAYAPFAEEGVG